ncbi:Uncharacterised protein [Mycobacteroides abscessus]|nr:Uncharacterised protein [Mycobacteroides abscessus]
MTAAPVARRAVTTAVRDHPAAMSDLANGPENPKVAADTRARITPARKLALSFIAPPACHE